jgi:hypothetical protein
MGRWKFKYGYTYNMIGYMNISVEDTYLEYLSKTTQSNLIGIGTGPHFNKMTVEYPLEVESY